MLVDISQPHLLRPTSPFPPVPLGKYELNVKDIMSLNNPENPEQLLSQISFFESSNVFGDFRPVTNLIYLSHSGTVLTCCTYVHLPQSLYTINCLKRTISDTAVKHWIPELKDWLTNGVKTIIFVIQGDTNNLQKAYDNTGFQVLGSTFEQSFLNLQENEWNCTIYLSGDLRTGTKNWRGGLDNKYIVNDSGLVMICTRK